MTKEASLKFHMNLGMLIRTAHNSMTEKFVQNVYAPKWKGQKKDCGWWLVLGCAFNLLA